MSEYVGDNISQMKGLKQSEEAKHKIGEASKERWRKKRLNNKSKS